MQIRARGIHTFGYHDPNSLVFTPRRGITTWKYLSNPGPWLIILYHIVTRFQIVRPLKTILPNLICTFLNSSHENAPIRNCVIFVIICIWIATRNYISCASYIYEEWLFANVYLTVWVKLTVNMVQLFTGSSAFSKSIPTWPIAGLLINYVARNALFVMQDIYLNISMPQDMVSQLAYRCDILQAFRHHSYRELMPSDDISFYCLKNRGADSWNINFI